MILFNDPSDQESLTLHQVKAHDGTAFAASKAFQSGFSLELWEEFSRKGPPAPQVCLPIASLLVDGISSNLAHIFSSPGKIF